MFRRMRCPMTRCSAPCAITGKRILTLMTLARLAYSIYSVRKARGRARLPIVDTPHVDEGPTGDVPRRHGHAPRHLPLRRRGLGNHRVARLHVALSLLALPEDARGGVRH